MPLDLDSWPLTRNTVHLCIDMQNIFAPDGAWPTPWMPRVLPVVEEIAFYHAAPTRRDARYMATLLRTVA